MGIPMTAAQAKAKARREINRHLEEAEEEELENAELNLVPYLDIITNTLMFLLATITMTLPLVNINVTQPAVAPPGAEATQTQDLGPKLNLTVTVTRQGFTLLAASGSFSIPPKPDGTLDYEALHNNAVQIKQRFPQEFKFNLTANPGVPYAWLVATMDAMRGEVDPANPESRGNLFPDVAFVTDIH